MVGMMYFRRLVSSNCREQKKSPKVVGGSELVPLSKWSATVHPMIDLPEPAWPVSQKVDGLSGEELNAHRYICSSMSMRFPLVHCSPVNTVVPPTCRPPLWNEVSYRGLVSGVDSWHVPRSREPEMRTENNPRMSES